MKNGFPDDPSAGSFLRELQRRFSDGNQLDRRSSQYLRLKMSEDPDLAAKVASWVGEDYALVLLERLRPRLPEEVVRLLDSEKVAIGELGDPTPNATCHLLDGGSFVITFNIGLRDFNYRIARALATRVQVGPGQGASVSFDDTCRYIADIYMWFVETGEAHGPDYPLTDDQFQLANLLTWEINAYFLAHEIGHGVLHSDRSLAEGQVFYAELDPFAEELLADRVACGVLLNWPAHSSGRDVLLSYAAIEIALLIWRGLEEAGIEFAGSHPAAAQRLAAIREACLSDTGRPGELHGLDSFARPLTTVFENVLDRIASPAYQADLACSTERFIARVDRLLTQCSGGAVPDYMTFYREADQIFSDGHSAILGGMLVDSAQEFFGRLSDHGDGLAQEVDPAAGLIAAQRFKLFTGYVGNLSPSVRSVFQRALGLPADFFK